MSEVIEQTLSRHYGMNHILSCGVSKMDGAQHWYYTVAVDTGRNEASLSSAISGRYYSYVEAVIGMKERLVKEMKLDYVPDVELGGEG